MALIGKIRAASGLTVIVIGVAMVAFILGDLFGGGGRPDPSTQQAGSVFGDPISYQEFDLRVQNDGDFIKSGQQGMVQDFQVRQQIWRQMVRERVLGNEIDELGISITRSEFDDLRWGDNILPELQNDPSVIDSLTGQVKKEELKRRFQFIEKNNVPLYNYQKQQIRNGRLQTKLNELVKRSIFVNSLEAKFDFEAKNTKLDLRFIARPFENIADSLVNYGESDLEAWYSENKNNEEYEQGASRSFDYVVFNVEPTPEDIESIQNELRDLAEEFESSEDDTLLVSDRSSSGRYVVLPYIEGTLDLETDNLVLEADTGDVIGPYKEGDFYKLAKIKSMEMVPEMRYEQIQISPGSSNTVEEAEERADSLIKVIKAKRNFAEIVAEFSDDLASKSNDGVIEWIEESRMSDKKLAADIFGDEAKENELRWVRGDLGVYIYRILEKREHEQRNLVVIDIEIKAQEGTYKEMFKVANRFTTNNTLELFHSAAEAEGLVLEEVDDMPIDQRFVRDLREPTLLISWVNRADINEVSEPFRTDERFVVAILKDIKEKGAPSFQNIREIAVQEVLKEKKAEQMLSEMSGISDIDEMATHIGETVRTANEFTFASESLPGGFQEPELIGLAFALQPGQTTVPLKGDNGVYVIKVEGKTESPEISDVSAEQRALLETKRTAAPASMYRALERKADVQDDRAKVGGY